MTGQRTGPIIGPITGQMTGARWLVVKLLRTRNARTGRAAGRSVTAVLAAVLSGALAAGCPRHLPIERPYPPPAPAELRDALAARQRAVRSMNARVRATSWIGGNRVRATVLMLADRAGKLRFEAEVSLQGTVAVLATDGARFAFLDTQKNELRRGPACPANVAALIRIPLGPAEVAAILLGDARVPDADAAADTVAWDGNLGADVLAIRRGDGWLKFFFRRPSGGAANQAGGGAAGDLRVVGATATGADGRPLWRAAFEDFVPVATGPGTAPRVPLPEVIHFAEGSKSFDDGVELRFKDRILNEPPPANAFALSAPAGTTTIDVGCAPTP